MAREHAVRAAGDPQEKRRGAGAELREVEEEGAAHRGTGVVEQAQERILLGGAEYFRFHAANGKRKRGARNRETDAREK